METARPVLVIGGANTDVVGVPARTLLARDSNPGTIRESAGGVARNIAENLARAGVRVALLTAFGDDACGSSLRGSCEGLGIDTSASIVARGIPGARYLAVLDERHDMSVAINDMRALDALTPEALAEPVRAAALEEAAVVVLDTNVSADVLEWVAAHAAAPIVLDPVSVAKAGRAARILSRLAAVTPNAAEAGALLGREVAPGLDAAEEAARELVSRGVGAAFVTCSHEGVAWADAAGSGTVPAPAVEVVNASGAGDAFCAGVAWAVARALPAREAVRAGSALAALALADGDTVSRKVTPAVFGAGSEGENA